MQRRLLCSVAVVIGLVCSCSSARESTTTSAQVTAAAVTNNDAAASAVDIRAIGCKAEAVRGAGAMIAGNYILTAAHVVSGSLSINVTASNSPSGEPIAAYVAALDPANDLALLSVPGLDLPTLPLGTFAAGDTGSTLIFRDDTVVRQPFTIVRPVIVKILDIYEREKVDRKGYQIDAEIVAGDSGAVLVDGSGRVGATLYAKSKGAASKAWAVGTDTVPALVELAKAGPIPQAPVGECAR